MTLEDAALSRLALGVVTAVGVIVAVLTSMLVSMFSRRMGEEREALSKVRSSATDIYGLLASAESEQIVRYFGDRTRYETLAKIIAGLSAVHSLKYVPSFPKWRQDTDEVRKLVEAHRGNKDITEPGSLSFHSSFVSFIAQLDEGIRLTHVTGIFRNMERRVGVIVGLGGVFLVAGLFVALISEIQNGGAISDNGNIWIASFLLAGTLLFVLFIVSLIAYAGRSTDEWMDATFEELEAESSGNITLWLRVRRWVRGRLVNSLTANSSTDSKT